MRKDTEPTWTDRWSREIELQKVYGLTPSEATVYTLREAGMTIDDLANHTGLSAQTVKNVISKSRSKIKREVSGVEIFIIKPNQGDESSRIKTYSMDVLFKFISKVSDIRVDNLTHVIRVAGLDRANPGDVTWMNGNVFRYVDLQGLRGTDDPGMRAERIAQVYHDRMREQGITESKVGFAVIKYCLDANYITYDIMEGI